MECAQYAATVVGTIGVRQDILSVTASGTQNTDGIIYVFHYKDTGLRRDVGTVSYVESRGRDYDNAAKGIIQKLQDAGVKRGQVLSIDAHASEDGKEAVFSAHYSLQMKRGPTEGRVEHQENGRHA